MPKGIYERPSLATRFANNYTPEPNSGCWLWTASIGAGSGYGKIYGLGQHLSAHRASYIIHKGQISDGLSVLHRCDVKTCVNPDHLYLGTALDNTTDMMRKGRNNGNFKGRFGELHPAAKLTADKVRHIRASNKTERELAKEFEVTASAIHDAKSGRNWRNV
jgi:HNH endonuclease